AWRGLSGPSTFFVCRSKHVDARDKPGHDDPRGVGRSGFRERPRYCPFGESHTSAWTVTVTWASPGSATGGGAEAPVARIITSGMGGRAPPPACPAGAGAD